MSNEISGLEKVKVAIKELDLSHCIKNGDYNDLEITVLKKQISKKFSDIKIKWQRSPEFKKIQDKKYAEARGRADEKRHKSERVFEYLKSNVNLGDWLQIFYTKSRYSYYKICEFKGAMIFGFFGDPLTDTSETYKINIPLDRVTGIYCKNSKQIIPFDLNLRSF